MKIDYDKCKIVIENLHCYFSTNMNLSTIEYPSDIKYGTNKYFIYMFYSCLLDYGMKSKLYHTNLSNTYNNHPEIFIPESVINIDEKVLKEIIINNIHSRYPNIALKKWLILSNELSKYPNIIKILRDLKSFNELIKFIVSLKSYGQKTGGLLARIIVDSKVCNFEEKMQSIPIDRHDIEISYLTDIINSKTLSNKEIKKLSDCYVKVGNELNINPSEIDKYLWEVGNTYCNKKRCIECPLNIYCKKINKTTCKKQII